MISTHILDTSLGNPAKDVTVELAMQHDGRWDTISTAKTNADGRINFDCAPKAGTYRLQFQIEPYFKKNKIAAFFPVAEVKFQISNTKRKYHVPLLLNPYGYSTYRGS
jgi:5-hydroxyisourate hydrolase